jgi:UDP-glucose 4-epimerase
MEFENLDFERALVTGGAGFVGSHLVEKLSSSNVQVIVLDNLSTGFESNLNHLLSTELIKGDVRNPKDVQIAATKDIDIVFHLAEYIPNAEGHVIKSSTEDPVQEVRICVEGILNVLEECRKNDSHFVLASTAAVYGSSPFPLKEDTTPDPVSPYGVSKLCAEQYSLLYRKMYGLPITILRFFNVFGPRQRKYLMYDFLKKARGNPKVIELLGTGNEIRDYIFIDDVLSEIFSLIKASQKESLPIFNVGTGVGRTTRQVSEKLKELLNLNSEIKFSGYVWPGTSNALVADMSKTRRFFRGNLTPFDDAIAYLVSWFKSDATATTKGSPLIK